MDDDEIIIDMTDDESEDIEVIEFFVDDEDIDELIGKLNELKVSKEHIHYSIDDQTEILVHHVDSVEEDDEEDMEDDEE